MLLFQLTKRAGSLDEIEFFHPSVDPYEDGHMEYRMRLFDYNDYDRNHLARRLFEALCNKINVQIQKKIRFTSDMFVYRVAIDSLSKYQQIEQFEGLYSVERTSPIELSADALSDETIIETKAPEEGEDYPIIGVLDTGITPIGYLSPWLLEKEHTNYPEEYADRGHGTAVASIIEYSDEFQHFGGNPKAISHLTMLLS